MYFHWQWCDTLLCKHSSSKISLLFSFFMECNAWFVYKAAPETMDTNEAMIKKPNVFSPGSDITSANFIVSIKEFMLFCTPFITPRCSSSTFSWIVWVIVKSDIHKPNLATKMPDKRIDTLNKLGIWQSESSPGDEMVLLFVSTRLGVTGMRSRSLSPLFSSSFYRIVYYVSGLITIITINR